MLESKELFEQNLEFFKELNPALAERFANYEALSSIVYDDDDPDILFQGMKLYGTGAKNHAQTQLENFWKAPGVITLTRSSVTESDSEGLKFLDSFLEYGENNGVTFCEERTTRQAFHLIVLGVGLGQHLEALLDDVKPRNLILVEPNEEFLYQSLFCFDWKGVIGAVIEDGGNVHILTDRKTRGLNDEIRRVYAQFGRASFDGLTIYAHYENPSFYAIQNFMNTEGDKLFSGLGFFEDEINMIANTYNNLKNGKEKVFYAQLEPHDFPVFVVGSGPSLDGAMEVIKANQDKAVIISCGTAMMPLLRAGVYPDYHVELERAKYQMEIPKAVSEEFDISNICLAGSTTLVPGVKDVFEKRVYYFRHMLSSFPAFSGNIHNCLRYPSPTVGNTGVSFAQDTGFRQIYLFGIDLGFVDPEIHHSTHSVYFGGKEKSDLGKIAWDRTVRGNFGGKIKSTHVLQWTRDTLEISMATSSMGYTYNNCSDGALINGALPLLPEFVDLPEPEEPKKVFVERMINGFPTYADSDFQDHWKDGRIIQDVRKVGDQFIACIRENPDLSTKKYISEMMKIARPLSFDDAACLILRGSLFILLIIGEHYLDRIEHQNRKSDFIAFMREAYIRRIDSMCDEVAVEISSLEKTGKLVNRETVWA